MNFIKAILRIFKGKSHKTGKEKDLTLFDTSKYDRPGYTNYKKCPNCGLEGHTNQEIQENFGLINSGTHVYIQSWCRQCRKNYKAKDESTRLK